MLAGQNGKERADAVADNNRGSRRPGDGRSLRDTGRAAVGSNPRRPPRSYDDGRDVSADRPRRRITVITRLTRAQAVEVIERLEHRAEHLRRRIADRERAGEPTSYDRAELAALRQAVSVLRQLADTDREVIR